MHQPHGLDQDHLGLPKKVHYQEQQECHLSHLHYLFWGCPQDQQKKGSSYHQEVNLVLKHQVGGETLVADHSAHRDPQCLHCKPIDLVNHICSVSITTNSTRRIVQINLQTMSMIHIPVIENWIQWRSIIWTNIINDISSSISENDIVGHILDISKGINLFDGFKTNGQYCKLICNKLVPSVEIINFVELWIFPMGPRTRALALKPQ